MTKIPSSLDNTLFWIAAAAIVVFVYFFCLNAPLLGPDEPRYSQVAREMFERGDWVTPTLGGFHWFEKPALLYWLQIASYHLFGVSEFAARFGSSLFGLGTIGVLWALGRKAEMAGAGYEKPSGEFANWLALIAASSIGLIAFSHGASFDIILTFPLTAAMICFFLFDLTQIQKDEGRNARSFLPLFGFYFFVGVAILAKGLVGIVFPIGVAAFYFAISRRLPSRALLMSVTWGCVVTLAVAATWYLPMFLRHGWPFVDEFFVQHHFQRYISNKYLHPQPSYFFVWVLPLMTIPWLPFFVMALWTFGRRVFYRAVLEAQGSTVDRNGSERSFSARLPLSLSPLRPFFSTPLLRFSIAWLLVPLVFFSFSGSKLPGYILPAVPPAMIVTTLYLMEFIQGGGRRVAMIKGIAVTMFVVLVAVGVFALPRFADIDSVKGLIEAADRQGHRNEKVLTLHDISHNAEFYAAGRLVRTGDGRQARLLGAADVVNEIRKADPGGVLVLVRLQYIRELTEHPMLASKVIRDNGDLAIVHVRAR